MLYYIMLVHAHPQQVNKLCRVLKGEIYIHLDKTQNLSDRNFISLQKDNIHFIRKRLKINWGGWNMVEGTLNGLKEILPKLKDDDHVIIISGQDYIIKNNETIINTISKYKGKSIIDVSGGKKWNNSLVKRYTGRYYRDLKIPKFINHMFNFVGGLFFDIKKLKNPIVIYFIERFLNFILPQRKYLINKYNIYGGNQRMVLSTKHIKYLLDYLKTSEGKIILKKYKRVLIPDESFFHTLLLNSKYSGEIVKKSLRYIDWSSGPEYPKILTLEDYHKIKHSGKLFGRKFDEKESRFLIEKLNVY